ncbi:MAG: hypothetical protein ACW99Q_28870, partial [Candidatus Kariarchaeaceae archaeon]
MLVTNSPNSENMTSSINRDESLYVKLKSTLNLGIGKLIGNTPMLDLSHLTENPKVRLLAKAEFMNPGGSV